MTKVTDWSVYAPYFEGHEFASPDTGEAFMDQYFMGLLLSLRIACDFPFGINSGFRSPEHNRLVGGGSHSAHLEGKAADIRCRDPYTLVRLAIDTGRFAGIGIKQHGDPKRRFIHLDTAEEISDIRPRPHLWSYS